MWYFCARFAIVSIIILVLGYLPIAPYVAVGFLHFPLTILFCGLYYALYMEWADEMDDLEDLGGSFTEDKRGGA